MKVARIHELGGVLKWNFSTFFRGRGPEAVPKFHFGTPGSQIV